MTTTSTKRPTIIVIPGAGGSTGKTTVAVNMACALAKRGKRVRSGDGDAQGDTSTYYRYLAAPYVLADVLGEQEVYPDGNGGLRVPTLREIEQPLYRATPEEAAELGGIATTNEAAAEWMRRITVVPSGTSAKGFTLGDAVAKFSNDPMFADNVLESLAAIDEDRPDDEIPDFEIWDLHGTVNPLTYFMLRRAKRVILVVTPDDKSTGKHLREITEIVKRVAKHNKGLDVDAVVPVRVKPAQAGKFYVEMMASLKSDPYYGPRLTPHVREAVAVPESYGAREPLLYWEPDHDVIGDFEKVVDWLVEHKVAA